MVLYVYLQVVSISSSGPQRRRRQTSTENSNFNVPITVVFGDVEFPDDVTETEDPYKVNLIVWVGYSKVRIVETVGQIVVDNLIG